MGVAITKWFSSIHGIWIWIFECATYSVGVIGKKCVGLGYSVPCRQIYVVFCAWDICKSLDLSSKLHHSPLHGLACSTTFSWRKIFFFLKKVKILTITIGFLAPLVLPRPLRLGPLKILTITIGFLAPLVLGNVYACIRVPSAPRAWPPNYVKVVAHKELSPKSASPFTYM